MAFFNPFGALSAGSSGFLQGQRDYTKDAGDKIALQQQQFDMMGLQALGRAFQPDQGPLPPNPGQASLPPQPTPQARPMPPLMPPQMAPPMSPAGVPQAAGMRMAAPGIQPTPSGVLPPAGAGAPPAAPTSGGPPAGGMPQLDLPTLIQRIQAKNPGLPDPAMVAALNRAIPLLSVQGKMELARLQAEMRQESLGLRERSLDLQRENLNLRQQQAGVSGAGAPQQGGLSDDAKTLYAERFLKTGAMPAGRTVSKQDQREIMNRAAEINAQQGGNPADLFKKQQQFKAEQVAIGRFMSGPQGNTIRSLGVVVDHLATVRQLSDALKNNDIVAFNRMAQAWAAQTGQAAPTNLATAAQIVGAEIVKSLGIAGAGTKEERQEAANAFAVAKSPEQISQAIDKVVKPLLLGQLKGLRRQFTSSTGLAADKFDELLGPEAQQFFSSGAAKYDAPDGGGFDRAAAKKAGYTDKEIDQFLKGK